MAEFPSDPSSDPAAMSEGEAASSMRQIVTMGDSARHIIDSQDVLSLFARTLARSSPARS